MLVPVKGGTHRRLELGPLLIAEATPAAVALVPVAAGLTLALQLDRVAELLGELPRAAFEGDTGRVAPDQEAPGFGLDVSVPRP